MMNVAEWSGKPPDWEKFMELDGSTFIFNLERASVEDGRSFSADALDAVMDAIKLWIGTRLMRDWDAKGEPPVSIDIVVSVQNNLKTIDEAHRKWREQ